MARQVGLDPDTLTPRNSDALDQYVQDAIRDIYIFQRWEFLEEYYRVRLYAADSDGTIAVTAAGTTWTGTDTSFDTAMTGGVVKVRADGEEYRITTIDSTTQLTATDAALRTLTEEDFVLYMDEVSLDAAVENVEACWVSVDDRRLRPMEPSQMVDHKSRGFYSGHPQFFAPSGRDSNGYTRVSLWPIPAYDEILNVKAYKAGTVPTADDGTCDIPDQFQGVVLARAKMHLHEGPLGKQEYYAVAAQEYGRQQSLMVQQACVNQGPQTISLDPAIHGPEPVSVNISKSSVQ